MTMTELCEELRNWFVRSDSDVHEGTFTIEDGIITPSLPIVDNQYYRIIGSLFNDGVHIFSSDGDDALVDETFSGSVAAMAVPPTVIALLTEISEWETKYAEVCNSPYQSESFGGYSYSRSSSTNSKGDSASSTWQNIFSKKLNKWRKI